jgi:phosphatidylserine decarboxylase
MRENKHMHLHQYIDRRTGQILDENLLGDHLVRHLYGPAREKAPLLFRALTSARACRLLSYINFDNLMKKKPGVVKKIVSDLHIDLNECLAPSHTLDSARKLFERQIRYWQCRPMPEGQDRVVSPADAKVLVGSLSETADLFIKEKFFNYEELLGCWQHKWLVSFSGGDFAVFRLTPEKYHYNHMPVAGRVLDFYGIEGQYHSCNPSAVIAAVTPYSKNKRIVTIIDTDVSGGTGVGLVAMIEIVALMIGDIVQCYSEYQYHHPRPVQPGMFVRRGCPKSLFRPGSSVDVLIFQKNRLAFEPDLLANRSRTGVHSRFTLGFRQPLVETDVQVRSAIGTPKTLRCS